MWTIQSVQAPLTAEQLGHDAVKLVANSLILGAGNEVIFVDGNGGPHNPDYLTYCRSLGAKSETILPVTYRGDDDEVYDCKVRVRRYGVHTVDGILCRVFSLNVDDGLHGSWVDEDYLLVQV